MVNLQRKLCPDLTISSVFSTVTARHWLLPAHSFTDLCLSIQMSLFSLNVTCTLYTTICFMCMGVYFVHGTAVAMLVLGKMEPVSSAKTISALNHWTSLWPYVSILWMNPRPSLFILCFILLYSVFFLLFWMSFLVHPALVPRALHILGKRSYLFY